MVTPLLLLLASLTADLSFVSITKFSWWLQRDGKPVQELPLNEAVTFEVPANWREPVDAARKADSADLQKQLYIAFLKKRFGYQIVALNQAYGLDASAFTELESSDFAELDDKRREVLADDASFAAEIYADRVKLVFQESKGKLRLLSIPNGLPAELTRALVDLATVDAILLRGAEPVPGIRKPIILLHCPAVKPAFATACARI